MKQLMKLRHGVIKSYFEKNKYKKASRNEIIEAAEETEVVLKEMLGDDHVHFLEANPEIKEFMDQVNKDNEKKETNVIERKGHKQGDLPDIARLRINPTAKADKVTKSRVKEFEIKAFYEPSTFTEDSDDRALADRSFNQ